MNVQRSLHLQYYDEVPLSKAPNPQLLTGHRSINGCPLLRVCVCVCSLLCVCVHLDGYTVPVLTMTVIKKKDKYLIFIFHNIFNIFINPALAIQLTP